jgi:AcrR family transcriptional regulator
MEQLLNKPRTARGLKTLNKILSAAAQVFYEVGYSSANVTGIARLAGVATGTFYIYFDSKYHLYKYLLLQCSHQIRKHLSESTKHCKTRREVELTGTRCWLEYIRENPYVYNLIWESLYVDRRLFEDYYDSFGLSYVRGINAAKERGEVRGIDSDILAYVLMGSTSFIGLKWGLFAEGDPDLDYIAEQFAKLLDNGMFEDAPARRLMDKPEEKTSDKIRFDVKIDEDFFDDMQKSTSEAP